MTTIPLPRLCLTLLPPWPQAFLYASKRLENRSAGVAAQIGGYRGMVGLSQSKGYSKDWTVRDAEFAATDIEQRIEELPGSMLGRGDTWQRTAGKLVLVAELIRIDRPHEARGNPWHVPGQHGLIFGRVWEVEPVACVGGVGAWRSQWCVACKKVVADTQGLTCKTCLSKLVSGPDCPALNVVREVLQ
jgi:hypothetical protein